MDDFQGHVIGSLSRIETKLDNHKETLNDHEARIRTAEAAALVAQGSAKKAEDEAKKKAAVVGITAGVLPTAFKAAWTWFTLKH